MNESELYEPVRKYLTQEGYDVDAEVHHCDVVGLKGDELVIVELKTSVNIRLLVQLVERQALARQVYAALPAPSRQTRQWRNATMLLKRLGAGLLLVDASPLGACAYRKFKPSHKGSVNQRRQKALLAEFNTRTERLNTGGVTGQKIVTAYRETAICIATMLDELGPLAPRQIKPVCGARSAAILQKNYYGWFQRPARGIYDLTTAGRAALKDYPSIRQRAAALVADHR